MRTPRGRLLAVFPLVMALLTALPREVPAYDVYRDAAGRPLRLPTREVAVFVIAEAAGDVGVGQLETAVLSAIERWQAAIPSGVRLVYGGMVGKSAGFDVSIGLTTESADLRSGEPVGTVRMASKEGVIERAELRVNAADLRYGPAEGADGRLRADLRAVVTHLLGHALGLAHSRDLAATMGFLPLDADRRSLEDDDEAGARFQAGAASAGRACDACEGDGDCAPGHNCLRWPNGSAYCAASCVSHDDCVVGQSCGLWKEGKACLPNGGHCAPDLESVGLGKPCASDLACGELICLALGDTGFCTAGCDGFCGGFGTCTTVSMGGTVIGLCLPTSVGGFGAPCEAGPDCASLQCAPMAEGGGRCAVPCTAGCPQDAICDEQGLCVRPGAREVGWPCASGFDCASGHCVESNGTFPQVCALPCELAGDCPDGTGCTPTSSGAFCLPFGATPLGFPCLTEGACGNEARCVASDLPEVGVCRERCDAFAAIPDCEAGGRCVWVDGEGVCQPSGGGGIVGAPCDSGTRCRVDLLCVRDQAGAMSCRADCDPATGAGCGASEVCATLEGDAGDAGPARGVCATADATFVLVEPDPAPPKFNFAARTLNFPDVVRWAPPAAEEGAAEDGCGGAPRRGRSGRPWTGVTLLLVVVAGWALRRRTA